VPTQVHDGGDDDGIPFDRVNQTLGESSGAAPTVVRRDLGPSLRIENDSPDRRFDLVDELPTQPGRGRVVVVDRLSQVAQGGREESIGHWARRVRSSLIALGPSTAFSFPAR